ncbi:MAG: hypothetical protein ACFFEF_12655 [Candidatus Thorarchaeota archaeon]
MKHRYSLIISIIVLMVLGNAFPIVSNHEEDQIIVQENGNFQIAQEYNISTYLQYSDAALIMMLENLYNSSDGSLWRSADYRWEIIDLLPSLADYYWAISSLERMYEVSVVEGAPNATISVILSRLANKMVEYFKDDAYLGYIVNLFSHPVVQTTKRPGVQAYAYQALKIAESVNSSLDFTEAKQSAIDCLVEMLYDSQFGGFHFFTMRNGSLSVPGNIFEVYPNDGKRLDHLALGAMALYEAGVEQNNATLIAMANSSMSFLTRHMKESLQGNYFGLKLAVNRTGHDLAVIAGTRPGNTVVSDVNAIAIRALLRAYNVTGNSTYLALAETTIDALMNYSWDDEKGGFFAETLYGEPFDPLDDEDVKLYKYSEIQFQLVITMEELYELTSNLFFIRISIDVLDLVLSRLWDVEYGGFIQNANGDWESFTDDWKWHHTSNQALSVLALQRMWRYGLPIISSVRINPVSPRPTDDVWVSATALDNDGIDMVYVNYTCEIGEASSEGSLQLAPNPEIGGLYNSTFGTFNDTARVNFYVIANDTLGNAYVAGVYYFIVRADNFEPLIELRRIYPDVVHGGDIVRLEFGTYEFPIHSATLCCTLYWKLGAAAYAPINTTLVGVDENNLVWQIDLGPFQAGDVISYYCMAVDETGNWGVSPFYRLTITDVTYISPLAAWQIVATIGLVSAPGAGVAYVWSKKRFAREQQRTLKKEARKRGRRSRGKGGSRSRSRSGSEGGN